MFCLFYIDMWCFMNSSADRPVSFRRQDFQLAALYGNSLALRVMLGLVNIQTVEAQVARQRALSQDGLGGVFDYAALAQDQAILRGALVDLLLHYPHYLVDKRVGSVDKAGANLWAYGFARAYADAIEDRAEFAGEQNAFGRLARSNHDYAGTIDVLIEHGVQIGWKDYQTLVKNCEETLGTVPSADPVLQKIRHAAIHNSHEKVLVVFNNASDPARHDLPARASEQAFHAFMNERCKDAPSLELVDWGQNYWVFAGDPDDLQQASFRLFGDYVSRFVNRHKLYLLTAQMPGPARTLDS